MNGVSLDLEAGRTLCLVGESGAGKSVAGLAMLRLEGHDGGRLTGGRIVLRGAEGEIDLAQASESVLRGVRGRRIGIVFQDPMGALNPVLSVGAHLVEALRLQGRTPRGAAQARARELLEEVGMPEPGRRLRQYPHQLSGGLRQRVMIALALARDPDVLIADEATSALDVTVQAGILALLDRLRRDRGLALLVITHDMGVVAQVADRVAVMQAGRIVEEGPVRRVLDAPRHPATRALLDAARATDDAPAEPPARGAAPLLQVSGLGVWHDGVAAVRDASLEIGRGRTLALVGESGSGKTTLARALMQMERAGAGRITFDGQAVGALRGRALRAMRARMQMVFQDPMDSLDPRMRLGAQVGEPLRNYRIGARAERRARVAELFALVQLDPALMRRFPHQVSGGQRQRVAIARALALNPALILADEPVSALDPPVRAEILALLRRLQAELGLSYLFVTHDMNVVAQIAHDVAVMQGGRIVESGPAAQVLTRPEHAYTRALLAAAPRLDRLCPPRD
ncbi:ABC transporter ATP-binding protein [Roseovarius spongiae]|uniref:ABC transporter ATP-binding protein n=1 Tax=Roseovarius spongiae TaxID=2320272 RepID=A0A3A8B5K7_9RHOB|nr:ABC transporter ATP-binding protein [Roseovarius spongiae]